MFLQNPIIFLRSIKGAPTSVLLALLFTRRAMTNQELQRWTGYSDGTITQATRLLVEVGWISAHGPRGPWSLHSARGVTLTEASEDAASLLGDPSLIELDAEPAGDDDREEENVVKSLYALYDAGIHEPTAGRLAHLPHVTPEYVAAHVEQANAQGFPLGIAIYRIEHAWPLPQKKPVLSVEARIRRFLGEK